MTIQNEASNSRILPRDVTAELIGVNLRTLERLVAAGEFPKPVRVSPNRLGFIASEVEEWVSGRPRAA